MRTIAALSLRFVLAVICLNLFTDELFAALPADPQALPETQAVLTYLSDLPNHPDNRVVSGQHTYVTDNLIENIYTATGKYVGLVGIDYFYENNSDTNAQIVAWSKANSLITVCHHWNNPATGGDAWDTTNVDFVQLITPGTNLNNVFNEYLDEVAAGFQTLQDNGVVVLYRPLHQVNGPWFWWGGKDPTQFKNVWMYVFNYMTQTKGLHNLLWVFSSDDAIDGSRYPGSRYVDIIGVDLYGSVTLSKVGGYDDLPTYNKPFSITEWGACDPSGGCPPQDISPLIASIKTNMPKTVYWMAWADQWSMYYNTGTAVLLNDPWVVTRDEIAIPTNPGNLPPVVTDDSYSIDANTILSQAAPGVLGNDVDPEGAPLVAQLVSAPAHGTLTLNANGSFMYTPATNFAGSDRFTYTANDGVANSIVATVSITVVPKPALSAMTVNPASVIGGIAATGTVTLSMIAPNEGTTVTLSDNSPAVSIPASVTVQSGTSSATFPIKTSPVASTTTATISAVFGGVTKTAALTINPPSLITLSLNPATIVGGVSAQGTVSLNGPAPAGGAVVSLSDNSPVTSTPASVTILAGSTSATFSISSTTVTSLRNVTITASYRGVRRTATLTVTPSSLLVLSALAVSPTTVTGGTSSQGTVTISGPAPAGGAVVSLSDNSSATTVPASVTVLAGNTSNTFTITTSTVTSNRTATISALYGGVTRTATLTVTPPAMYTVSGAISPAPSGGGTTVTLTQGTTTVATVTAASDGTFAFPSVTNGTYTVTPAKAGFSFTPSSTTVTVNGANISSVNFTAAGLAIDLTTSTDRGTAASSIATSAFTTRAGNELLLAFVSTDATGATPNVSVTGVTGGGLAWTLVKRTNAQFGTAEIWRAFATTTVTNATVTATLSQSIPASITVMAFAGVNATTPIGATGGASGASGPPTASLTTQGTNSWVFAVGNDYYGNAARTPGTNQTMVHQYLVTTPGIVDAFWVQRQNATVQPAGTPVTINDTAPTTDGWNMSIVEIIQ